MKSIIKLKIKGLDYHSLKQVTISKTLEADGINFIDEVKPPLKINNGKYTLPQHTISAKDKADQWISTQTDFLNGVIYDNSHELQCILNWEVISIENIGVDNKKTLALSPNKKQKMSDIEKISFVLIELQKSGKEFTEEFRNNFLHTYKEMKGALVGLSIEKQMSIVIKSMRVGIMAATNAYQHLIDLLEFNDDETKKLN